MDEQLQSALTRCQQFIQTHSDYTPSRKPLLGQGSTNRVVRAIWMDQPVIFKFFNQQERKERELFGLQHWAETGLVPRIIEAEQEDFLVISEVPGDWLPGKVSALGPASIDAAQASQSLGWATARLTRTPLTTNQARAFERRFYHGETLKAYLTTILKASKRIQQDVRCYQSPLFKRSLKLLEEQWDTLFAQPHILYHQDAANVHFVGERFSGFFDLEMCRVGTEAMQIGSLFVLFERTLAVWKEFLQGYQVERGKSLSRSETCASLAFAHFMVWRSISRYGEWTGSLTSTAESEREACTAAEYATALSYYNAIVYENLIL